MAAAPFSCIGARRHEGQIDEARGSAFSSSAASMVALAACATTPAPEPAPVAPAAEPSPRRRPKRARTTGCSSCSRTSDEAIAQAQSAQRPVPRRPALRRPARRLHHRRILCGREGGGGAAISPRFTRSTARPARCDRPARLRRVRISRPRTRCAGYQPDMLALTEVRPINHFFGFHTFYPTFASGQGRGAVQDASPTMRTT